MALAARRSAAVMISVSESWIGGIGVLRSTAGADRHRTF
jgi:hypothetical protein